MILNVKRRDMIFVKRLVEKQWRFSATLKVSRFTLDVSLAMFPWNYDISCQRCDVLNGPMRRRGWMRSLELANQGAFGQKFKGLQRVADRTEFARWRGKSHGTITLSHIWSWSTLTLAFESKKTWRLFYEQSVNPTRHVFRCRIVVRWLASCAFGVAITRLHHLCSLLYFVFVFYTRDCYNASFGCCWTLSRQPKMSENIARLNQFKNHGKDANVSWPPSPEQKKPCHYEQYLFVICLCRLPKTRSFAVDGWRPTWSCGRRRRMTRSSSEGTCRHFLMRPLPRFKSEPRTAR